jgi:transcriptional regulator with XRE-family HTH domain
MKITRAIETIMSHIKSLREEAGYTRAAFADMIGMDRSQYSKLEKYGGSCDIIYLLLMCRKLHRNPWVLMRFALEHEFDFTESDEVAGWEYERKR